MYLSHTAAAETGIRCGLRTEDSDNTTTVATAVQRRWACHTRRVSPADAYGRQRCTVMPSASSVVCLWFMSWAVCSLERAAKNRQNFTGTYVQNRPHIEKPGKTSYPLSKKKKMSARHASYSARIELKPKRQVPDGLPAST